MLNRIPNYPLACKIQETESTQEWKFVRPNEIREFVERIDVNLNNKLFAFDKNNYRRMIKPKGVCGAIREILYSRICEKLGILCECAQFIVMSTEHTELVNGESHQAGIFLLPDSKPLGYWLADYKVQTEFNERMLYESGIKNPDHCFSDQIANTLFGQFEPGEYEVTPEGYLVRVDIDRTFSNYIIPIDENGNYEEILERCTSSDRLLSASHSCKEELRKFVTTDSLKKALKTVCQLVASWTDEEIIKLSNFPEEFQGAFYGPLVIRLITGISRNVAREFT